MPLSRGKPPRHHNGWVRKTLPYLGAWFIAGLLAVALASVGVSMVTEQVTTNNRPAALGAAEVRDELASIDQDGAAEATPSLPEVPPTPPTGAMAPGSSPSGSSADRAPAPGDGPSDPSTPTTTIAPVPTTLPAAPTPVTRTYDLIGGTATLRFTSEGVTIITATPKAGFSVDIEANDDDGDARVEFESDDHLSRLDAWWDGGPQNEVREERDS